MYAKQPAQESDSLAYRERVRTVTDIPGFVALWDFVKRESAPEKRFTAHVREGEGNDFALDATNYVKDFWDKGRPATYEDFPLMGRGPFGNAIRISQETDPHFRPCLQVPRERLHDSSIDIKGTGKSLTLVVWAIRERGGHALAGVWHEGTDIKEEATEGVRYVERGQRQYGLFTGLNAYGSACGHVSDNGEGSFGNRYALHKANSAGVSFSTPGDAPDSVLDSRWECFAMTFNHETQEIIAWLNGHAGGRWEHNVAKTIPDLYYAWKQSYLHSISDLQERVDPEYPADQYYLPPEDELISVSLISENEQQRIEIHEFRYTKVRVTMQHTVEGFWRVMDRDLESVRLNPWWYPHGIYTPADDGSGGPFTIGRVIHSARTMGTTGWIGGVAVYDRALKEGEMQTLARLSSLPPLSLPMDQPWSMMGPIG